MGVNQNRPLSSDTIRADREALLALKKLQEYAPVNPAIRADAISAIEARLSKAEEDEVLADQTLDIARGARIAAGWELHNAILMAKSAVNSQYGPDSDAIQSMGLKKKSNYRRPVRRRRSNDS